MRMASPGDFFQKAKWQLQLRLSKSDWNTAIWPPCQVLLSPSEKPKCCTNFWSYRRKRQPFSSSFQPQGQGSSLSSCFWLCHKVSALPQIHGFPSPLPALSCAQKGHTSTPVWAAWRWRPQKSNRGCKVAVMLLSHKAESRRMLKPGLQDRLAFLINTIKAAQQSVNSGIISKCFSIYFL